jgi:non-lysosomal glucosylceramidase
MFVKLGGAGLAALAAAGVPFAVAGPFDAQDTIDHFVPVDKKLRPEWVKSLFARGDRTWYEGEDLKTIGMPVSDG